MCGFHAFSHRHPIYELSGTSKTDFIERIVELLLPRTFRILPSFRFISLHSYLCHVNPSQSSFDACYFLRAKKLLSAKHWLCIEYGLISTRTRIWWCFAFGFRRRFRLDLHFVIFIFLICYQTAEFSKQYRFLEKYDNWIQSWINKHPEDRSTASDIRSREKSRKGVSFVVKRKFALKILRQPNFMLFF